MSNKLIGVSPPPLGQALDSKVDLRKDFKETSSGQYKNDFEKALKEKLATKEKAQDANASPPKEKESLVKKDDAEREVDREEKNSSGGTKKRMNEKVDDQMVSMLMASQESEVEIPESKNDLVEIEDNQPIESIPTQQVALAIPQSVVMATPAVAEAPAVAASVEASSTQMSVPIKPQVAAEALPPEVMQKLQQLPAVEEEISTPPVMIAQQQQVEASPIVELEKPIASELQQIRNSFEPVQVQPKKSDEAGDEIYIQPKILPEQPKMMAAAPIEEVIPPLESLKIPDVAVAAPVMAASILSTAMVSEEDQSFDFEKDLGDEVGFKPEAEMKSAEVSEPEIKPVSLKAQDFEKSVYEQLQKMDQRPHVPAASTHEQRSVKKETGSEESTIQGIKADAINPNEVHHVGQTQSEFKAHLTQPTFAGSEQQRANILEQNHEKNIQEVMNQAEYLVKKGGGEMKVSMSPDGLSEVHLKVALQDGKVNIEMLTHDKAVKKMMEDSLTELKSGLAAQQLSVEHVKISSVSATNTDNSAQFQSNWNQSGGEHQQREYWNQFQENLNQRQNFAKRSNYGGSSDRSTTGSMAASSSVERAESTPRTYGGTKGSQINWVA